MEQLFEYYFYKHKTILCYTPTQNSTVSTTVQLLLLKHRINLTNPSALLSHPDIITKIINLLNQQEQWLNKIENQVLTEYIVQNYANLDIGQLLVQLQNSTSVADTIAYRLINAALQDNADCVICFENRTDTFYQCGHGNCQTCAQNLTRCPMCRRDIETKAQRTTTTSNDNITSNKVKNKDNYVVIALEQDQLFLQQEYNNLIRGAKGMISDNQREFIANIVKIEQININFEQHLPADEIEAYLLAQYFKHNIRTASVDQAGQVISLTETEIKVLAWLKTKLTSPNRVLRFLAVLNDQLPQIDVKIKVKFPRRIRKWLAEVIANFKLNDITLTQLVEHQMIWQYILAILHSGKNKQLEHINKIVRNRHTASLTLNSKVENLITTTNEEIFTFLLDHPGVFYRQATRLAQQFPNYQHWDQFLAHILVKLNLSQLMDLTHILQERDPHSLVTFNKEGKLHYDKFDRERNYQCANDRLLPAVRQELSARITALNLKANLAIVDTDLGNKHIQRGKPEKPIPWTNTNPSQRGDWIDLSDHLEDEFIVGIWWQEKDKRVDLDLSVVGFDDLFTSNPDWKCDYTHTRAFGNRMQHSGDITEAKQGASEYIAFRPSELLASNTTLQYLVMGTYCYNRVCYDDMREALLFVGIRDQNGIELQSQKGPFNIRLLSACRLHGQSLVTLNCMLDLFQQRLYFMNMHIRGQNNISMSVASNDLTLINTCRAFINWQASRANSPNWLQQVNNIVSLCPNLIIRVRGQYYVSAREEVSSSSSSSSSLTSILNTSNPISLEQIYDQYSNEVWIYCGNPDEDILALMPANSIIVAPQPVSTDNDGVEVYNNPSQMLNAKQYQSKDKGKEPAN